MIPPVPPFHIPVEREVVTREPSRHGDCWTPEHSDREWLGFANQGGGKVPESHWWTSNPKQRQDDLGAK